MPKEVLPKNGKNMMKLGALYGNREFPRCACQIHGSLFGTRESFLAGARENMRRQSKISGSAATSTAPEHVAVTDWTGESSNVPNFILQGPDAFIFEIDPLTGAITPKSWFLADFDDAWDANEDNIYEMSAIDTDNPDAVAGSTDFEYRVTPTDAMLVEASAPVALTRFTISGPDTVILEINKFTGEVTLQDWFAPEHGDNWDADEDGIYDFNIVTNAPDGTVVTTAATLTQDTEGTFMVNAPTIDILPEDTGPVDPPVTGTELLTNGLLEGGVAFESNDSDGDVDGWATSSGTVDVWGDGFFGVNTPDGGNFIQVDTGADGPIDTVYQDVRTLEDDQMELEFSAAQRSGESESL